MLVGDLDKSSCTPYVHSPVLQGLIFIFKVELYDAEQAWKFCLREFLNFNL